MELLKKKHQKIQIMFTILVDGILIQNFIGQYANALKQIVMLVELIQVEQQLKLKKQNVKFVVQNMVN